MGGTRRAATLLSIDSIEQLTAFAGLFQWDYTSRGSGSRVPRWEIVHNDSGRYKILLYGHSKLKVLMT